jgi:hypothetical protein
LRLVDGASPPVETAADLRAFIGYAGVTSRRNDMAPKTLAIALGAILSASPLAAASQQSDPQAGAPPGGPETRYCLRVEPITGSHIPGIACLTREEWAEGNVDVDKVWAEDGVGVEA